LKTANTDVSILEIPKTVNALHPDYDNKQRYRLPEAIAHFRAIFDAIVQGCQWPEDSLRYFSEINETPRYLPNTYEGRWLTKKNPYPEWLLNVAQGFFELTADEEGDFIKRLRKCPYCNQYYLARDLKRTKCCYSASCEKEHARNKKKTQRENDPLTYA
jgi:hypothetical protein